MPADPDPREGERLVAFYRGTGTDGAGRTLSEILQWDDGSLECHHDYIQWVFPLRERSAFNPSAPVLDDPVVAEFRQDPELQEKLVQALGRMLAFYGLEKRPDVEGRVVVAPGPAFEARSRDWLQPGNHNHLRLTRIMVSLATLGLADEARALQRCLLEIAAQKPDSVTEETLRYWKTAVPD